MCLILRSILASISNFFPSAVFYTNTSSRVVSLTIDDVGGADTLQFLDVIDKFNQNITSENERIRATFFVITDYLDHSLTILDEILDRGHEIGNHGQKDHRHASLDITEFTKEISQAHNVLSNRANKFDKTIKWCRPGQAFYNDGMLEVLQQMPGYYDKFALASMIPLDTYQLTNNPSFTNKYLCPFIFPGSILVLHGVTEERSRNTVEVLCTS